MGVGGAIATGCGDDAPTAEVQPPAIVEVETQRCRQPNRFHGAGIVVGDDLVLTAGHTVEGDLRALTVDGEPARVVAIDRRTDLAVLSADVPDEAEVIAAPDVPEAAQLLGPDGTRDVAIDRHVTLVVEHATDQATYRRDVVIFTPGVTDGESGSPIVDDAGRLVGIVWPTRTARASPSPPTRSSTCSKRYRSDDLGWPDPPGALLSRRPGGGGPSKRKGEKA